MFSKKGYLELWKNLLEIKTQSLAFTISLQSTENISLLAIAVSTGIESRDDLKRMLYQL
jgi:hypothetical protein